MKLRLPNKLQAALAAALASVSFTTLSTGTLAVATGAAILAGQQAQAEDPLADATYNGTFNNGQTTLTSAYASLKYGDADTTLTSWMLEFTITQENTKNTQMLSMGRNPNWASSIERAGLGVFIWNDGKFSFGIDGSENHGDTLVMGSGSADALAAANTPVTIRLAYDNGTAYLYSNGVMISRDVSALSDNQVNLVSSNGEQTYANSANFFTNGGANKFSNVKVTDLTSITGQADKVVNYIAYNSFEAPANYSWVATGERANWTDQVWNKNADPTPVTFADNANAAFGAGNAPTVDITTAATAGAVTVSGQNYTFNLSGSNASLTANALTVESGLNITGSGDLSIGSLAGAGGFVKDSSGTLVLNGDNSSYSGAITVNAGTLDITNWNSLGSQAPTAGANGTIQLTTDSLPTSLTVNGEGTLRLLTRQGGQNVNLKTIKAPTLKLAADSGHNSRFVYEVGSNISEVQHLYFDGGQLWLNSGDTVLNYGGTITFGTENHYSEGGGLDSAFRVNASAKFSGAVDVQKAAKITWQTGGKYVEFANAVTGSGNLTLATYNGGQFSNSRFIISGDASKYTGSITTSHTCITVEVASGGKLAMGSNSNLTGAVTLAGEIIVNDSATISGAITGAGTLTKNGDGTLTLSGDSSGFTGATTVNAGALSMNGGSLGGTLTVGESAEATFSGAVTLASHIQNSGSVVFNSGSTLTLTCSLDDLEGETTYTDGESGFISGVEKRIASGTGTVTGLTSVTIGGATYTKDAGQITDAGAISIHDTNYTTYYLRTEGASVDVPAQQAEHTEFTKIDVAGKGGTSVTGNILVNGTVSLDSLNIAAGNTAAVALSEGATTATANITALTHDGTLDIGSGVTVHYAPTTLTMAAGKTLTTTGAGTFEVTTLTVTGGTLDISSDMKVTGGDDGKGGTKNQQGLAITDGSGSISILGGTTTVTGAVYTGGGSTGSAINVGTGNADAVLVARRIELGDHDGDSSAFTIGQHGKVVVTGNEDIRTGGNPQKNTSLQLSEWNQVVTSTIQGKLFAREATAFMSNDKASIINVNGGTMAVKGIATTGSGTAINHTVSVTNGGKLVLGATGIAAEAGTWAITLDGSEIGMTADTTLGRAMTLSGTANFNTTKYAWSGEGAGLALNAGTAGGTMTVSGNLSGAGKLVADGTGTLVLSGTNTYSGGTEVNGGTLQAASAGALGSGDVTVNAGTLELTTTTAVTGALTINEGGTLVFAGENMLTADSLAVNGAVTFDLNNIVARRGTITLATGTTEDGALTNVNVTWTLPSGFACQDLRAQDNAWVIDIISTGQALTWAGGTRNWSYSDQDLSWLTPDEEPAATYFTNNDTAVFKEAVDPAVANITEAITTAAVEVQAGANVSLQAATGAEAASLTVAELDIAGSLATSVDVAATAVEAAGADAAWNITAGSVTADSITVAENGTLALSGTGMAVKTVSGPGTVEVGDGFTLTLSQQIDSEQATNLSILNNGTVAVALGSSQNVINMDADSTGTLEVTAGTISSQSSLGDQTLKLAGGTVFAVKGSETAFASDITLAGNVSMQLKDGANATIAGAVSGDGKTLSVSGGGANQTVTFTDTVTLGGLNVSGSGEKLVFQGTGSNLGAIYAQNGAFTIQFSKAEGADSASYTFGTFDMSPTNNAAARWLIVDAGVTVQGTGSNLADDRRATIHSAWGISGGGLEVYGTLTTAGVIGMEASTAYIKGSGTINAAGLNLSNGSTTYVQDGITINITTDRGVYARNDSAAPAAIHLKNATLQAKDSDWTWANTNSVTVTLDDASTGTAFEAATGHTITLSKAMGGSGKLVKKGEGTVLANAANTYSGGTAINAGTLATNNNTALGTGDVNIADGTLEMRSSLTIAGNLTGTGDITYTGNEAGTLSLSKRAKQNLTMDIGSAAGAGALNLTLNGDSDYDFSGNVVVNNITQSTSVTMSVVGEGDVTAAGKVLTGRLVVGAEESETGAVFTLSGENAMLVTSGTEHTYGNRVQGYGTFKLEGGATQRLTGNMLDDGNNRGFHGTFWADGAGSVLTIDTANIYGDQVTFMATNGGQIVLSSSVEVKETAVDNGTFELNAAVETLNVSGGDNTLDIGTGSVENISLGGDLKVAGELDNFYIHSGTTGTVVTADAGKKLVVDGTAHVDARVEFHSSETQKVEIAATRVAEQERYALESDHFDVTAATVEKVAAGDVAIANKVSAATVENNVAEDNGKLSLTAGVDLEALKNVIAASGDIEFLNVDPETQATLDNLTIAHNNTVSFSTDGNTGDVATEATVTVAGTLTAGEGATLNANLVMDGGEDSPAVLDVHAMGGIGGLNMGSDVTLVQGRVALSQEDIDAVTNLQFKDKYDLFNGVEDFYVGDLHYGDTDVWVNAKDVFTNDFGEKDYYLFYSGANQGGVGGNVGTIYIMQMPEPTTGTLSLLALAALAARRRRR